jgi:putative ABC transport system substrate-binding protein
MKYGLLDSLNKPGRNITGVYQADYLKECIIFLKNLLPNIKTITILSDDSVSSRAKIKKLRRLSSSGELHLELVTTIVTNNLNQWKTQALDAAKYTDAFFMLNHNTLKDATGRPANNMEIGAWYLRNINKPEISYEEHFIVEGMLAAVSDSGVKQGYQAMELAIQILAGGNPGKLAVTAPRRGDYVVNKERAKMLGVYQSIKNNSKIEAWIDHALALKQYPE